MFGSYSWAFAERADACPIPPDKDGDNFPASNDAIPSRRCDTQRCCPAPLRSPRGHAGSPCRRAARARNKTPLPDRKGAGVSGTGSQVSLKAGWLLFADSDL
jgi:hypothetical protein